MKTPATPEQWSDLELRRQLAAAARPKDLYVNVGTPQGSAQLAEKYGALPDDFAYFLDAVGCGIAPSGYNGLDHVTPPYEGDDPQRPFPFIATVSNDEVTALFERDDSFHGALSIASLGCGYSALLVITGAARGAVFHDYLPGDAGVELVADSFFAWYAGRVDGALRAALRNQIIVATERRPYPRIVSHEWLERWPHLYAKWHGGYNDDYILVAQYLGDPALAQRRVAEVEATGDIVSDWVKVRLG